MMVTVRRTRRPRDHGIAATIEAFPEPRQHGTGPLRELIRSYWTFPHD